MTKEVENNMQYLIGELHKEWDKSGEIFKNVGMSLDKSMKLRKLLVERIVNLRSMADGENVSFKKTMKLTKQSFLLTNRVNILYCKNKEGYYDFSRLDFQ